jgi:hypothetical protein
MELKPAKNWMLAAISRIESIPAKGRLGSSPLGKTAARGPHPHESPARAVPASAVAIPLAKLPEKPSKRAIARLKKERNEHIVIPPCFYTAKKYAAYTYI